MLRVGVVGLGMMGQHHMRVFSELDCELCGAADACAEAAKSASYTYKVPSFTDYKELAGKVDAVSIAVPTSLHNSVASFFLKQGVHCLVEKPIASNVKEAEELINLAQKHNAKLMVGHIERFNPAVIELKRMIDEGVLGKLMIVSTRRVGPFVPRIRDVGIIIDSATHDIDTARYLMGKDPVHIYSKTGRFKHQKEDHAILVLDFGTASASIEVNWFTPHKTRTLVATGSKGIAELDYIKQELTLHTYEGEQKIGIDKKEPLRAELTHFLYCVNKDLQPLTSGNDGLQVLKTAIAACG